MSRTRIERPPRTLPAFRAGLATLLLVPLLALSTTTSPGTSELELLPKHFTLHPGEQIRYEAVVHPAGSPPHTVEATFAVKDSTIVRLVEPVGKLEAVRQGRTELLVRTPAAERRVTVEVAGRPQPPMIAVPHETIHQIVARDLLFVGHANLDGWDHTAVAKHGIDRLVKDARKNGWTVVYWVSNERPYWYTDDRHPDYAIISEGQEHEIRIDAERVVFAGGGFMWCTLRNAQMTLHGMLKHNSAPRIHFVFPAQAIWETDAWGPGEKRWYPAPMVVLTTLFARRANDVQKYNEVVVPFLDRMIQEFPVLGYPPNAPTPPLRDLLKDWSVVVRFGDRFERVYRQGDSNRTLLIEFQGV